MNWSVLRLLYIHEMRMLLRARRTVILAIVLPAVIMPIMLYAQKYSAQRRQNALRGATYRYAITGPLAERVRALLETPLDNVPDDRIFESLRQFKFVEVPVADARATQKFNPFGKG